MMRLKLALAMLLVAALTAPSYGWIVTQQDPLPGAGIAESVVVPFDTDPGLDMFEIHKYFMVDEYPLVLKFVKQSGDQNTIQIVDESIMNMMTEQGRRWEDYHIRLIYSPIGNDRVWFKSSDAAFAPRAWQMSGGAPRLGFTPDSYTTDMYGHVVGINWFTTNVSQMVPYGEFWDAPTNQLIIRGMLIDVSELEPGDAFYLKQWPTTPEPATLLMLAGGFSGLLLRRRKRLAQNAV